MVTGTTALSSLCVSDGDHSLGPAQEGPRRIWKFESKVRLSHIIQFFWHQNSCAPSLVVVRLTPGIPFQ